MLSLDDTLSVGNGYRLISRLEPDAFAGRVRWSALSNSSVDRKLMAGGQMSWFLKLPTRWLYFRVIIEERKGERGEKNQRIGPVRQVRRSNLNSYATAEIRFDTRRETYITSLRTVRDYSPSPRFPRTYSDLASRTSVNGVIRRIISVRSKAAQKSATLVSFRLVRRKRKPNRDTFPAS